MLWSTLVAFVLGTAQANEDSLATLCPPPSEGQNSDGSLRRLPYPHHGLESKVQIVPYACFEPQAAAFELVGYGWYSWSDACCFQPSDVFDVRVVVYHGVSESDVRTHYPTQPGVADYRYVRLENANVFLDTQLSSLDADEAEWAKALFHRWSVLQQELNSPKAPR